MNRKRFIALALILATIIIGGGAVYIGIKLGQQPDVTPDDVSAATYNGIIYQYGPSNQEQCELVFRDETVCLQVKSNYRYLLNGSSSQFASHFCDGDWSVNGQGCSCPGGTPQNCSDRSSWKNNPAPHIQNITPRWVNPSGDANPEFYTGESVYQICLQRDWCNFQQIDVEFDGDVAPECFLSGYTGNLDICKEEPEPLACNSGICTEDAQCKNINPNYECDFDYDLNPDGSEGMCQLVETACDPGEVLEPGENPCSCVPAGTTITPTPTDTPTNTPTGTLTITNSPTNTPTNTPTRTPTNTPTGTLTRTPTGTITRTVTNTPTGTILPPTALISNEVDLIVFGLLLVIAGGFIYKSGLYISIGQLYWNNGGKNVSSGILNVSEDLKHGSNSFFSSIKGFETSLIMSFKKIGLNIVYSFKFVFNKLSGIKNQIILGLLNTLIFVKRISKTIIFKISASLKSIKIRKAKSFEEEVINSQKVVNKD